MAEEKVEQGKNNEKKPKSKARKIIEWALTIVFGIIFVILGVGQISGMVQAKEHYGQTIRFGYCTFVVQTDSMEPDYGVGHAIITYREKEEKFIQDFNSGKTVDLSFFDAYGASVKPDNHPGKTNQTTPTGVVMTHRLIEYRVDNSKKYGEGKYTFFVAGINTESSHQAAQDQYQAFTEHEYLGRVISGSPVLGGVFRFVSSVWGLVLILLIPTGYIVVVSVLDIFKAYSDDDEENLAKETSGGVDALANLSPEERQRLKDQMLQDMLAKRTGNQGTKDETEDN